MDQNESCEMCVYFYETNRREKIAETVQTVGYQSIGYCRANPPHPYYEDRQPKVARFPVVLSHMWCGLFEEITK